MKKLFIHDAISPADIAVRGGMEYISPSGLVKMIAVAAFHHPINSSGREKAEKALSLLFDAAKRKGFARCGELKTAFAITYPPSLRAKQIADDLAACFKGYEIYEAIGAKIVHK